jgi:hypothetical protein
VNIQAKVTALAPPNGKIKVDAADAAVEALRSEIAVWERNGYQPHGNVSLSYKAFGNSYRWHASVTMVKPW